MLNGEGCNLRNTVWCEGGLKLEYISNQNVREDELNHILVYVMLRVDSGHNTCTWGVIGYIRVWRKVCYGWLDWIKLSIWLNKF